MRIAWGDGEGEERFEGAFGGQMEFGVVGGHSERREKHLRRLG